MNRFFRSIACAVLATLPVVASAQALPLDVDVSGETATVRVGNAAAPVLDLQLDFDDASGLTPAALGLGAQSVSATAASLLARLPSTQVSIPTALPVLLTVQPPAAGGLSFDRRVHVEIHTHQLSYTAGSRYRLFKSPLGGAFRDVTGSVEPGSVRTRGTTGGFSQFMILLDQRPTDAVVDEKIAWLRARIDLLPATEAAWLDGRLDTVETAVAASNWQLAMTAIDQSKVRVTARAGTQLPDTWSADGSTVNHAGELLAGLDTLAFSIGFLRDFGP